MSSALSERQDIDVGRLLLQVVGRKAPAYRIDGSVTGATLERTMDGAGTLTIDIDDTRRTLLRSGVFDRQLDVQIDGTWWRMVKVAKTADQLELTFEDRVVAILRTYNTPRKAARSSMTRAAFAKSLVQEAGPHIPFISPDLLVVQQIEAPQTTGTDPTGMTNAQRAANVQQGLSDTTPLTIKGVRASTDQRAIGQQVLDAANAVNAGERPTLALLQACIQESGMANLNYGDADSLGVLQVRQSTGAGMGIDPRDVTACANAFLTRGFYSDPALGGGGAIVIAARNPSASTGRVAQATQGSAFPQAYDQWATEARQWLAAYGGASGTTGSTSTQVTRQLPYQFQRGGTDGTPEDSWTCLQRLASEVQWRCFVNMGAVYFVSDTTLMRAKPLLGISEDTLGVEGIDFDVDNGQDSSSCTVAARASRWAAPPGSVVEIAKCGPANGRWLVQTVDRGLFDAGATITLARPVQPLLEPAPETESVSVASTATGQVTNDPNMTSVSDGGNAPDVIAQLYQAAADLTAKGYPYVWGGGHAHAGVADNPGLTDPQHGGVDPGVGFDCSGLQAAALSAVPMGINPGDPVGGSTWFAGNWGQPGEGQFFTLWANGDHVWSAFRTTNGWQHFGTGNWGSGNERLGFKPEMHPTAGFTPRHWPGA